MIEKWDVTLPTLTGDKTRAAYCYVPDVSRDDPERRFPVLYMFDGHNVFFDEDATYGKSWGMLEFLERSKAPLIVAAVACNQSPDNSRLEEYCPWTCYMPGFGHIKGKGKLTMEWLVGTFKPYIDENFPTLPDRHHTFIAGSSMGGLMTIYAISRYNRYFSRGAALSPSILFAEGRVDKLLEKGIYRKNTVLYMDFGMKELESRKDAIPRFAEIIGMLMEKNVAVTSRLIPDGEHNEASWERQVPIFINVLLSGLDT